MRHFKGINMKIFAGVIFGDFSLHEKAIYTLITCDSFTSRGCSLSMRRIANTLRIGTNKVLDSIHSLQGKGLITEKPYTANCVAWYNGNHYAE